MLNTETFQQSLSELTPNYEATKYLLAVSGGADSMVLLNLFTELKLSFEVAHVNYGLRGLDSEADQLLVEEICKENNILLHLYNVSDVDQRPKNSIQEWARILRYNFFNKIKNERNLDFTVTAHHLNDELETFIINLSKASGIKGLSGIPAKKNKILRPLLHFTKEEIYGFAAENKVWFREDLSNQKNDYLRNFIRNEITPNLLKVNENFLTNFGKSLKYLNESHQFIEENILKISAEIITKENNSVVLNKAAFLKQSEFVQFEILRKFNFDSPEEIRKIGKSERGKRFLSQSHDLKVDREILIITVRTSEIPEQKEITLEITVENTVKIPEDLKSDILKFGKLSWKVDQEKTQFPLLLRKAKKGDIFYPIGMIGRKKIAKFFKDEKLPILAHQKIWLLCDGKNDILGVIPLRQDGRFAATKDSSKIIKIKL